MEAESLRASIQHRIAELRGAYPRIAACQAALEDWHEHTGKRHSLSFDIRWPQHQSLISGPARESAEQAIRAALDAAERSLSRHA
jgi:ribosome-associated translation inhibitor RaiA